MRLFGFAFCAAIAAGGCALRPLQATIRIAPDAVHPVHQQVTALQRDLRIASACSNPESFETFPAGPLSTDDRVLEALASRFATASPGLCACFAETNDAAVHVSVTAQGVQVEPQDATRVADRCVATNSPDLRDLAPHPTPLDVHVSFELPARPSQTLPAAPDTEAALPVHPDAKTLPSQTSVPPTPVTPLLAENSVKVWYGRQVLIADLLSHALLWGGVAADNDALIVLGLTGLTLASPTIHVVQGNPKAALASAGVRIVAPAILLALTYSAAGGIMNGGDDGCHSDYDDECHDGTFWPRAVGTVLVGILGLALTGIEFVAAEVFDIAFLSRKSAPTPTLTAAATDDSWHVEPFVAPGRDGGLLGLAIRFP